MASKSRDHNIQKNYKREINLQTKIIKSKKHYNRKAKPKYDDL